MMKYNLSSFFVAFAMLAMLCPVSAQTLMQIRLHDGSQVSYPVRDIDMVTWVNADDDGQNIDDEDPRAVDLGLSVKWASMNVGANAPEEYGDHFSWGETTPKTTYNLSTYKWCQGTYYTMTKYCINSIYGTVDNKTTLEAEDDAATANWGALWRMPTDSELNELNTKCSWVWMTQNGVEGYLVTGPNGNSIFLPAAGNCRDSSLSSAGSVGVYWSSSLDEPYSNQALGLFFGSNYHDWCRSERNYGFSVRPVYTKQTSPVNPPTPVDLGLSVKWANMNVGASTPEGNGYYFAWGETTPKTTYDWSTYKWCNGSSHTMTKYCSTIDNKTTLEAEDDAATVNWGIHWRMPTLEEIKEMEEKCSWTWTPQNGVNGYCVTGPNGNSIFLPAAGWRDVSSLRSAGSGGNYWSSSVNESNTRDARHLGFGSGWYSWYSGTRHYGYSVRAVTE